VEERRVGNKCTMKKVVVTTGTIQKVVKRNGSDEYTLKYIHECIIH
jgi:hypothetical protein